MVNDEEPVAPSLSASRLFSPSLHLGRSSTFSLSHAFSLLTIPAPFLQPFSRKINMKWRWYTTWWLLPCVPSLSDHHDLSFLPFRPSFSIFPLHSSSRFPFSSSSSSSSSWRANTTVPRASSGTTMSAVWFFRPTHLVSSPSNPPRSPQGRQNSDGSLRPCRRIAADRSPSHQDAFGLPGWLARRSTSTILPPLVEYRRVAAPCVSSYFALPFGERAAAIPPARSHTRGI